jgi:hypothetical protein
MKAQVDGWLWTALLVLACLTLLHVNGWWPF